MMMVMRYKSEEGWREIVKEIHSCMLFVITLFIPYVFIYSFHARSMNAVSR
jgi:uncharacterized membrane protein